MGLALLVFLGFAELCLGFETVFVTDLQGNVVMPSSVGRTPENNIYLPHGFNSAVIPKTYTVPRQIRSGYNIMEPIPDFNKGFKWEN